MNDKETIKQSLEIITKDSIFSIKKIMCDEKGFGNIYIEISSEDKVEIHFTMDRGIFWCEIGKVNQLYFIEDVFCVLHIKFSNESVEFLDYIKQVLKALEHNMEKLLNAFQDSNIEDTKLKIKKISTERVRKMFDLA